MKTKRFTRKELYDLVWSTPFINISEQFDISDNGLRKICKRMNVAYPKSGYWQKQKGGVVPKKTPLSKIYKGNSHLTLNYRNPANAKNLSLFFNKNSLHEEIANVLKDNLNVPQSLINPDPLIKSTIKNQELSESRNWDKVDRDSWLDINTSEPLFDRALRLMDCIIKALKLRGHKIFVKYGKTQLVCYDQEFTIRIKEKESRLVSNQLEYNGLLSFGLGTHYLIKEWVDSSILLEDKIIDILVYIEGLAEKGKSEKLERSKNRELRERKEQEENDLLVMKNEEYNKTKRFIIAALIWNRIQILKEYIDAIEKFNEPSLAINSELAWARHKLAWFDPLTKSKDKLLSDKDRNRMYNEFIELNQVEELKAMINSSSYNSYSNLYKNDFWSSNFYR